MKVFLAGCDNAYKACTPHLLGYPYRLCSYLTLSENSKPQRYACETQHDGSEWIMDSGLFSFMFGSRKGELRGFDDYARYAERYLATMDTWGWKHAIVECDVQRVLGVQECFRLRNEFFRPSGREVIYVWHLPEGEDGLAELAARERRIALSVPEIRAVVGHNQLKVRAALTRLLSIVRKNACAGSRVHLLGNTEGGLLGLPADSCDSTSWLAGGSWGQGHVFDISTKSIGTVNVHSPKWDAWVRWCGLAYPLEFEHSLGVNAAEPARVTHCRDGLCSAISYYMLMNSTNAATTPLLDRAYVTHPDLV